MRCRVALFFAGGVLVVAAVFLYFTHGGSSVAQSSDARLIIYWEPNFRGPSLEVTDTLLDMPVVTDENGAEFDWNDQVRSVIVVSGTWRLWRHGRCNSKLDETPLEALDITTKERIRGWSCLISATSSGPLRLANCAAGGFSHDVSSIELVSEQNLADWALPAH